MPALFTYRSDELPPHVKWQIVSFVRVQWAWAFQGANRYWDYVTKDTHPVNIVLMEGDLLLSHVEINWRVVEHSDDQPYRVYGAASLFTYPSFRGEGHGGQVMKAATEYLRHSDGDLALLFCEPEYKDFYVHHGWKQLASRCVTYGRRDNPTPVSDDELTMVMTLNERAARLLGTLPRAPLYVGTHRW